MALPLIVDTLDTVPEPLKASYKPHEGKFRLDLEGYEDPKGLKSALDAERLTARNLEKQAKAWAALGKTPEEVAALVAAAEQAEVDKLTKSGDFEKLREQMNTQHAAALAQKDEVSGKLRTALERQIVDAEAVTAISELKGSVPILLPHVKASVKVVEDGDKYATRIVDAAGTPRVDGKGNFLTIKDLVSEMRQSDVFGRAFDGEGKAGSGAQQSGGTGTGTKTTGNLGGTKQDRVAELKARFPNLGQA